MSSVLVWVDHYRGKALPAAWEAMGAGRMAADALKLPLVAVVLGSGVDTLATLALHHGADKVAKADDATLLDFRPEAYAAILSKLGKDHNAAVLIAGGTTRGRELMASVAVDLDAALLSEITDLQADSGQLTATRAVYAGKVLSKVAAAGAGPVVITLRGRAFPQAEPNSSKTGEVITVAAALGEAEIGSKIEGLEQSTGTVNLTEASIIITGGRGVGSPDGFAPVRELATTLEGAVGASRAVVDAGWIPYAHQVGQTGKVVSPNLYVAAGLSGSIQHQAGMRTSKIIVAINKDPDAPIFKLAHYGIVGDLFKELPAINAAFKAKLGK
jgi:electron transfer flavoprotein alpha subunit